jgi:hypothetical protein
MLRDGSIRDLRGNVSLQGFRAADAVSWATITVSENVAYLTKYGAVAFRRHERPSGRSL